MNTFTELCRGRRDGVLPSAGHLGGPSRRRLPQVQHEPPAGGRQRLGVQRLLQGVPHGAHHTPGPVLLRHGRQLLQCSDDVYVYWHYHNNLTGMIIIINKLSSNNDNAEVTTGTAESCHMHNFGRIIILI